MAEKQTILVTFSGIDGAGKTTQIDMLRAGLTNSGLRFCLLTFWDDVAMFAGFREWCSHLVFRGDKGVGSPNKPINRKDKNVQSWPMMLLRLFYYLFDAAHLNFVVARAKRSDVDVVIFDRYIYDELANLPLQSRYLLAYARFLRKLVPRPDVAYLIDADPALARQRKPEYPYEFLWRNRECYLIVSHIADEMKIIASSSVFEAQQKVVEELIKRLPSHTQKSFPIAKAFIES